MINPFGAIVCLLAMLGTFSAFCAWVLIVFTEDEEERGPYET